MEDHTVFKWDQIDDHLFIGNNMCCQMHFDKELLLKGISADISLEDERVDAPFGVESYLWLPTADHTPPTPEQLRLGVDHIKQLVDSERAVYIHCKNGHGRAPTLAAAYYISTGITLENALTLITEHRRRAHLTDEQKEGLELFSESLSR